MGQSFVVDAEVYGGDQELNLMLCVFVGTVLTLHYTPTDGTRWKELNLHILPGKQRFYR